MANLLEVTDKNFESEVLNQKESLVLVDFWAPWCGPCRMMAPVLEQVSDKYKEKVVIGKLNVDENPLYASKYKIMSIPTMIVFKEGKPVSQQIGFIPFETLSKQLDKIV
ncbi:MAG: thioredoxin [Candidatus Eremiobacteraeota bacterium]|nr:thioredoxin [Candidatus Eremiobacteraeota bacterium]